MPQTANIPNWVEEKIHEIWCRILQTDMVERDKKFFDAGGNSMKAMRMLAELNKEFPGVLTISDLFKANTIKTISDFIIEKSPGLVQREDNTAGFEV